LKLKVSVEPGTRRWRRPWRSCGSAEQDAVEPGVQGGQVDLELVDVAVGVAAGQHGHGGVGDEQVQVVAGAGVGGGCDLLLEGEVVAALGHGVDPQPASRSTGS
jgi:hypothetical protein